MGKKRGKSTRRSGSNAGSRRRARFPPLQVVQYSRLANDLTAEELEARAATVAQVAAVEFRSATQRLETSLSGYEPLSLLALVSLSYLFGSDGLERPPVNGRVITQFHAELLQAMVLRHPRNAFPWLPTLPDPEGLLRDLDDASLAHLFQTMAAHADPTEEALAQVRARMRAFTQAVRNWGYPDQIAQVVTELFFPLDDAALAAIGVAPSALFRMFLGIIATVEARMGPLAAARKVIESTKVPRDLKKSMAASVPDSISLEEGIDQVRKGMLLHQSFALVDACTFTLDELMSIYAADVDQQSFASAIDGLSYGFGDLADTQVDDIFLDNPVWQRPFVRLDDGKYFISIPGMLLSFGLDILEALVVAVPALKEPYLKRRGMYLEDSLTTQFQGAFPDAEIYQGSRWVDGKLWENDVLVVIDHVAVVIEAKSNAVHASREGNPGGLKQNVKDVMATPSAQGSRFEQYLRNNPGPIRFRTNKSGVFNEFDTSKVKQFVRLNVSLRPLGGLHSRWPLLRDAGLIAAEVDMAPTMTLADLKSVFDVLDGPCQKLHYLARRAEFERNARYTGDELDLLALYLETGFNIGRLEFDSGDLLLMGGSKRLAPYFMRDETGKPAPKPRLVLSPWWAKMVRHTETTKLPGWPRLGMALLSVPYEDQIRIERRFHGAKQAVRIGRRESKVVDLIYVDTGPPQRRLAVGAIAYRDDLMKGRQGRMQDAAERVFDKLQAARALIIGVNVGGNEPWDDLAVFDRANSDSTGVGAS